MEVLTGEDTLLVVSGLQDSATCLRYLKREALHLEYLICITSSEIHLDLKFIKVMFKTESFWTCGLYF